MTDTEVTFVKSEEVGEPVHIEAYLGGADGWLLGTITEQPTGPRWIVTLPSGHPGPITDDLDEATSYLRGRANGTEPMSTTFIDSVVTRIKDEILLDIEEGIVPETVATFSELHDYVDANCYGGFCDGNSDLTVDEMNRIQSLVDTWLRNGRTEK